MGRPILPTSFFQRDTIEVARELLGKKLVRVLPTGERLAGYVIETEAYLGAHDPACHSHGFLHTPRTAVMYEAGGIAYVYLIYGMHHCFNVVTMGLGEPEAVLIRAVMTCEDAKGLIANGPGKVCRALKIDRSFNGRPLVGPPLFFERGKIVPESEIDALPRVGIDYAGDAALWPLRFQLKDPRLRGVPGTHLA